MHYPPPGATPTTRRVTRLRLLGLACLADAGCLWLSCWGLARSSLAESVAPMDRSTTEGRDGH